MAAFTDPRLAEFIERYLPRLVERWRPVHVILFGSHARGDALRDRSDLDLIIVSQEFAGIPFLERGFRILWSLKTPLPLDLLCYTPEEFQRKREEIGVVRTACEEGVDLVSGGSF